MTLLSTSLFRSRFVPFAMAMPIAVPSCSLEATVISLINDCSTVLSTVSGHWIKDSPAKTRIPILSSFRLSIKSLAVFLTASNLFGGKSSANILELMSNTKSISMTLTDVSCRLSINLGRASPKIIKKRTNKYIVRRNMCFLLPIILNSSEIKVEDEIRNVPSLFRPDARYQPIAKGRIRSKMRYQGC